MSLERITEILDNSSDIISNSYIRPDNTTDYDDNDVINTTISSNLEFETSFKSGSAILIANAKIRIDISAVPSGMTGFRLALFDEEPTEIADNSAFDIIDADKEKFLDYIDIDTPVDLGSRIFGTTKNINSLIKLKDGSKSFFGQLITLGGFTPIGLSLFKIDISIMDW